MSYRTLTALASGFALLIVAAGMQTTSTAQPPAFKRAVLQKADLSVPGREAVTAMAEIPGGVRVGKHTHPGEEIGYVAEGTLKLEVEGKPSLMLKAGDAYFVEAGRPHDATNEGTGIAKVIATYIVEKGKPLATPVP